MVRTLVPSVTTSTTLTTFPVTPGPTGLHVAELWRYPVKSLRGEQLTEAEVGLEGVAGDRIVHVRSRAGRLPELDGQLVTSRARPRLLGLAGTTGPAGAPLIDGHAWDSQEALALVEAAVGGGARLVAFEGPERFDILPLSVLTDGAIAALGVDRRRLRPNIVIGGVEGLAERGWEGRRLRIGGSGGRGGVVVETVRLRGRCVMTTFDPDTLEQDRGLLRRIVEEFEGTMSLDTAVLAPGLIRVGDPVELLD